MAGSGVEAEPDSGHLPRVSLVSKVSPLALWQWGTSWREDPEWHLKAPGGHWCVLTGHATSHRGHLWAGGLGWDRGRGNAAAAGAL